MSEYDDDLDDEVPSEPLGVYTGERDDKGRRHGQGTAILPNGDTYTGHYDQGVRQGEGNIYQANKKDGHGVYTYPHGGGTYSGEWENSLKHGKGVYTYANGDTYDGQWEVGLRAGHGSYTYSATDIMYIGDWKEGKMHGKGKLIYSDGTVRYHGQFLDDKPSGQGTYEFSHDGGGGGGEVQSGEYSTTTMDETASATDSKQKMVWHGGEFSVKAN